MSEHTGYPGAPPGWYPDPAGGPGQRWWDGYAWTEATVLPDRPPPPPTWSAAPPPVGPPVQVAPWAVATERLTTHTTGGLVDSELRMERIARVAVAVPAACAIVNVVVDRLNSDRWLAFGHQFRVIWHDAQNHVTPPPYHGPSGYSPVNLLAGLVDPRRRRRGAGLAAPRRLSGPLPGLPLPAIAGLGRGVLVRAHREPVDPVPGRQELPSPGDAHRRRVLHWWLAWLVGQFVGSAAAFAGMFSSGTAAGALDPGRRGRPGRDRLGPGHRDGRRRVPPGRHVRPGVIAHHAPDARRALRRGPGGANSICSP